MDECNNGEILFCAVLIDKGDELLFGMDAKLAIGVRKVGLYGGLRYEKLLGDAFRGEAAIGEKDDIKFSWRDIVAGKRFSAKALLPIVILLGCLGSGARGKAHEHDNACGSNGECAY